MQMAMITNIVASAAGMKNSKVSDFLISGKNDNLPTPEGDAKPATAFDSFAGLATPFGK